MHSWSLKHQLRGKEDFEGEGEEEEGEEEGMETDYSDMEVDPNKDTRFVLHHWLGKYSDPTGLVAKYLTMDSNTEKLEQVEKFLWKNSQITVADYIKKINCRQTG